MLTVILSDLGGKTQMQFQQSGGHLSAEQYAQARDGWMGFFASMANMFAA